MTEEKMRIEFKILAPEAKQVLLSGSFNEWSEVSDPMKKDETGTWKKIRMLPQGTYEYKFIVDGVWTFDPTCPNTVLNPFGTQNSSVILASSSHVYSPPLRLPKGRSQRLSLSTGNKGPRRKPARTA